MASTDWEARVADFWDHADRDRPAEVVDGARRLGAARPDGDAAALFELASAHDFVGDEEAAIPLYERALDAGLDERRQDEAVIQLASSLRNVGRAADAVALVDAVPVAAPLAAAAAAFRALALHDLGRHTEALQAALGVVVPTQYSRAIGRYSSALGA